jgi:hypothetical protein
MTNFSFFLILPQLLPVDWNLLFKLFNMGN